MSCMLRFGVVLAAGAACLTGAGCSREAPERCENSQGAQGDENKLAVVIETSMGTIKARLWADKAPRTVANFLRYVDVGFYDGLIFHRVKSGFMIQGGAFTKDMERKPAYAPIRNEAAFGLQNDRGTLAMARTGDPHSATSQFFINLVDNHRLNHRGPGREQIGYCVFGKVTEGIEVVDKIGRVATATRGRYADVPVEPVVIKSIRGAK